MALNLAQATPAPAAPVAVPKKKAAAPKKPAPKKPASPKKPAPQAVLESDAVTAATPAANGDEKTVNKGGRPKTGKRAYDWSATQYALFRRTSLTPVVLSSSKDELVAALNGLPVTERLDLFVAEFRPVKVDVRVSL